MQHGQTLPRRLAALSILMLAFAARVAGAGAISIQWDPNIEPDVIGYRVFIGTQPGVYSSSVDVGNTTTYLFDQAASGQKYCFAVAAYTAGPRLGDKSAEVCNEATSNQPPTLTNPGNQTSPVGQALTLTLSASDPEGTPVTFSAKGLPTGLTLNANTGFISGTPTTVATSTVTVTVSDGTLSTSEVFSWTISASLPGVATLLRPTGSIATATPTFEWESVSTATVYRLWVDDASTTDPKIEIDLTPTQAGCTTSGAVCHVSPGTVLNAGRASWSVRVSNVSGPGPWSGAMDFTVPDTKAPTVTITTPTSSSSYSTSATSIALGGTAADDAGVSAVTWTNNLGGSGTATGTTTWSVAAVPLTAGTNVITVTARDAAGNIATAVLTVTKADDQAPVLTILSPKDGDSTSSAKLAINGSASDDGVVTKVTWVSDRGGSGVATGTTAWDASVALMPGANLIALTAHDGAGHETTKSLKITLGDSASPTVKITSPTSADAYSTDKETVKLAGAASDDVGVTQVTWSSDRGLNGTASGTSSWSSGSIALKPGANVISVTAHDAAGNTSSDSITVTMTDGVAPVVTVTAPGASASTEAATIALGGTASDAFGVTRVKWASDKGSSGTADGTSAWSVAKVALEIGVNVITVTASDAAGNEGTQIVTVTRTDGVAPSVQITSPVSNSKYTTSNATIALGGTASDDMGVSRVTWANDKGGSGVAAGTTTWSAAGIALSPGSNVITVTAKDVAGNVATDVLTVIRTDDVAPVLSITSPTSGAKYESSTVNLILGGTASDASGVTKVRWTSDRGASGVASGTTAWSAPITLSPGANIITVTAMDTAGNKSTASVTISLRPDNRGPVISITEPTGGPAISTSENAITISGTATDDREVVEVTWTSSLGERGVASGTATWKARRIALKTGLNTVTITARDAAGNTSSTALAVRVTDVRAPKIRITGPTAERFVTVGSDVVTLEGSASDDFELARIAWASDRGPSGQVKGSDQWTTGGIPLQPGLNVITVTAVDAAGNSNSDKIKVTYERGMPTIALTSPTTAASYNSSSSNIALTGVASDDGAISRVRWSTDKGQAGDAVGTTSWSIPLITVPLGTTVVTVTAYDNSGNTSSVSLEVVYGDTSKPVVKIYMPTTAPTLTTKAASVTVAGTATDNIGVTEVTWVSDRGATGRAFGGASWSTPSITLLPGVNVITVTARDAAGNSGVAVITVNSVQ